MSFNSSRVFLGAMLLGVVCGGALTLTTALSRNGWLMLLPYIVLALITTLYLPRHRIESFAERFTLPFAAYVVVMLIICAYIPTALCHSFPPLSLRNSIVPFGTISPIRVVARGTVA